MIELFEQDIRMPNRHSSKGNQLKWNSGAFWYKADYLGYEGLAEQAVSEMLNYSSLKETEYIKYTAEEILYRGQVHLGAKSRDFLTGDWQIITLERLFHNHFGVSLYRNLRRKASSL